MKQPMMTRRHFVFIAEGINSAYNEGKITAATAISLTNHFEYLLGGTNPAFDRTRFYEAATKGIPEVVVTSAYETCSYSDFIRQQLADTRVRLARGEVKYDDSGNLYTVKVGS